MTKLTQRPDSMGKKILRRVGLVLLGIVLYTVCINMYGGYPEVYSDWINRAAIAVIVVVAVVVFLRHERHSEREDDGGSE